MKLPQKQPLLPRLTIVSARWQAVCGWCLGRSRVVSANSARDAWSEIASTEGFCVYDPEGAEPYPICLQCADAELGPDVRVRIK